MPKERWFNSNNYGFKGGRHLPLKKKEKKNLPPKTYYFYFLKDNFNLWHSLMMKALYY